MNIVPAQEIKRRGISVVDDALKQGPVHVVRNNKPQYVILSEERYRDLIEEEEQGYLERVKLSLEDVKAKRVRRFKSVSALIKALEQGD